MTTYGQPNIVSYTGPDGADGDAGAPPTDGEASQDVTFSYTLKKSVFLNVVGGNGGNGGDADPGSGDAGGNGGDSGDVTVSISGGHFITNDIYLSASAEVGTPGYGGAGDFDSAAPYGDAGQLGSAIAAVDDNVFTSKATTKTYPRGDIFLQAVTYTGEQQDADIQGNQITLANTMAGSAARGLGVTLTAFSGGNALVSDNTVQTGFGANLVEFSVTGGGDSGSITLTNNEFLGGVGPDDVFIGAFSDNPAGAYDISGNQFNGGGGKNTLTLALSFNGLSVPVVADLKSGTLSIDGGVNTITNFREVDASSTFMPVKLIGNNANNILIGSNAGHSILEGGGGADSLISVPGGDDTFLYVKLSDSTVSAPDYISEFHTGDLIDLHLIDANPSLPGRQSFHFESANTDGGDVRVHYDAAQNVTDVDIYLHGDTTPDALIRIAGHQTLTAADFIF